MLSKTLELIEYQQGAAVAHNFKGLRNACEKFAKTDYYATGFFENYKINECYCGRVRYSRCFVKTRCLIFTRIFVDCKTISFDRYY